MTDPSKRTPPAREKRPQATRAEVCARVDLMADLMRTLQWERGESAKRFAAMWGVSEDYAADLAAEASRRVQAEIRTPDEVRDELQQALREVVRRALADDDRRSIIDAARALGPLVGAVAPVRVEVDTRPVAERVAEARELAAEVVDLAKRLGEPGQLESGYAQCARPGCSRELLRVTGIETEHGLFHSACLPTRGS